MENKKMIFVLICFLLSCITGSSQDIDLIDSISLEVCSTINSNSKLSDSEIMILLRKEHFLPFMENHENSEKALSEILLRSEKLCPEYSTIAYRNSRNSGDWILLNRKPFSILSKSSCSQFFENTQYYYLEPTGERVEVEMNDGYWIDNFVDSSYSKLKIIEKTNCEFVIQFEGSNNETRSNFRRVGDKYKYQILSFENDKYHMSVEIPEQNQFYRFILYMEE